MTKNKLKNLTTRTDTKTLLIVITVILVGIFAIMLTMASRETSSERLENSLSEMMENASDSFKE